MSVLRVGAAATGVWVYLCGRLAGGIGSLDCLRQSIGLQLGRGLCASLSPQVNTRVYGVASRGVSPAAARSVIARVRGCLLALLLLCVSCSSCVLPLGPCPGFVLVVAGVLGWSPHQAPCLPAALPLAGCPVVPFSVCQCTTMGQQLQVSSPPVARPDSVPLTLCTSGGMSVCVSLWMSL